MRGHQPLIAMRLRGKAPQAVWVKLGQDRQRQHATWPTETPQFAHLTIPDTDRMSALRSDLRCLTGMPIHVMADSFERFEEFVAVLMDWSPKRVFAYVAGTLYYLTEGATQWQEF